MVNERLKGYILEVVDNQLNDNDPKCTKETLIRLKDEGYSETDAKKMIAALVVEEIYDVMKENQTFDEAAYCEKLFQLPAYYIKKYSNVKVGRNDPCPCGSGEKYKKCCGK